MRVVIKIIIFLYLVACRSNIFSKFVYLFFTSRSSVCHGNKHKRFMKYTLLLLATAVLSLNSLNANAQGMAVNTTGAQANASAIFDASSTTQGMLVPRMTNAQMTGISSPATGLLVYCTDCSTTGFYYYSSSAWTSLSAPANTTTQGNTFNGNSQLVQLNGTGQLPAVNGSQLTSLNATNLGSGTVPLARLGTNAASSTTFLRGDNTWATPAGGSGVTYTNVNSNQAPTGSANYFITANNVIITIPASPAAGTIIRIICGNTSYTGAGYKTSSAVYSGGYNSWNSNNLVANETVDFWDGSSSDYVYGGSVVLYYTGSIWLAAEMLGL
jgi:hypothetical protein